MPSLLKFPPRFALAALVLVISLPAAAQFQKPEDAIKYRRSAMSLQGTHVGRVFAMANGKVPFDAKVAAENIEIAAMLNRLQFAAFVEGTDKGETRAKPEIWTEKEKFNAAIKKSQDDVNKLAAAGKTGNLDEIKTAVGAVGQSCKACHDEFRKE
jgi:cytochrome c556